MARSKKGRWKEGRKEGRKGGREGGREEGRKEGRKDTNMYVDGKCVNTLLCGEYQL